MAMMDLFFFQAEDGIRDRSPSRGLGDVYKRQLVMFMQNFFYETAQMKLFIPKGSLPIGLRSVIVLIIFSIT